MLKHVISVLVILPLLGLAASAEPATSGAVAAHPGASDGKKDALSILLSEKLWTKRDAYDAAHFLMVPMHEAYASGETRRIDEFRSFIRRYLNDADKPELGRLTELQFNYLVSRFAVLESEAARCSPLVASAAKAVEEADAAWLKAPAWQWEMPDFPNMLDRIRWKLAMPSTRPSYLKAIIDEEFFAMAIAADLTRSLPGCGFDVPGIIASASRLGDKVLESEGEYTNGRWVFQPDVWSDHPDFAYAGNEHLAPDLSKKPVAGIGGDSSHTARFPLWLQSFRCAMAPDSAERSALTTITRAFTKQVVDIVIKKPTANFRGVRMMNFMTGQNGVYRYGYATVGPGGGFGPYGLSFTFNLGWWAFLGKALQPYYEAQLDALPFGENVLPIYNEPIVTVETAPRAQNPLMRFSDYLRGPLIHRVLSDASDVAARGLACP